MNKRPLLEMTRSDEGTEIFFRLPGGEYAHIKRKPIDWLPLLMVLSAAKFLGFFGWILYIFR